MFHFAVKDSPSAPAKKALQSSKSDLPHLGRADLPVRHPAMNTDFRPATKHKNAKNAEERKVFLPLRLSTFSASLR